MSSDLDLLNSASFRSNTSDNVLVSVISDPRALRVNGLWNWLVGESSNNPLLLSSYVEDRMNFYLKRGWSPLILIISIGDEIIGSVPIIVKRQFGVRGAKLLLEPHFSPDFVFRDEYREVCTEAALQFLFNTLNLNYLDFTLQVESPNHPILKKICKSKKIHFHESFGNEHRTIHINCSWDEFVRQRKKKYRKEFREIENRLNRTGSWGIVSYKNDEIGRDVYNRVLDIEDMSWKEKWRIKRGAESDEHYPMIWNASSLVEDSTLDYEWIVYFLELDGRAISFAIAIQFNDFSVILKTSYDHRYRKLSPGKFVLNAVIRDQFEDGGIRTIEFLTDLDFLRIWDTSRLPRARFLMSRSRLMPEFIYRFSESSFIGDSTVSEFVRSLFNGQALRRLVIGWLEG